MGGKPWADNPVKILKNSVVIPFKKRTITQSMTYLDYKITHDNRDCTASCWAVCHTQGLGDTHGNKPARAAVGLST